MMKSFSRLLAATSVLGLFAVSNAAAYDLTGAWANDTAVCEKIFIKKSGTTVFKEKSDIYGSGFIIDRNQIRGRFARCRITSQKETGPVIHLLAACSTDIMLSNVQFSLKVKDDKTIIRHFPGMEELELQYSRCP
jgi:hypothetical protein